jgi:DNA-directed RNA polymerase specialized sigma24 family protein
MKKHTEQVRAFYEAKRKYLTSLSSLLWQLTGTPELFHEAMYSALFGLWRHADKLKGKKAQKLLYRIALTANAVVWQNQELTRDSDLFITDASGQTDQYQETRQAFACIVRKAIAELPLDQSQAVVMRYVERKAYWEMAETLECPWFSVKHAADNGLKTLKAKVAEQRVQVA